ncbi:thioesterase II family protein [Paenibacillus tepidiphilus]|uniref:thioesterase II family protein n=1 Tax=Paenibacillus tepidiphilus TaxID=2608683 RepID=UPI0012389C1F|nr:alpha/beta fold hydrolase [Paenibacillus tepidiphilus]
MKLLCIPYAGSSAYHYWVWKRHLQTDIELVPLELAGRGSRYGEPFYTTFADAVNDLYQQATECVQGSEYILFGHSMGALLAYELAVMLHNQQLQLPVKLILSGKTPPIYAHSPVPVDEIVSRTRELGATPPEVLDDSELFRIFMPILEADYRILNDYKFNVMNERLDVDFSIFYGTRDKSTPPEHMANWKTLTRRSCELYSFQSGHFFINDDIKQTVQCVQQVIFS